MKFEIKDANGDIFNVSPLRYIIAKTRQFFWRIVFDYHAIKLKNFQKRECSFCGKKHLFDVPTNVPDEQILFVCTKCDKKREPFTFDVTNPENTIEVPVDLFPDCEHVRGSIIVKDDVMYCECKICGKLY